MRGNSVTENTVGQCMTPSPNRAMNGPVYRGVSDHCVHPFGREPVFPVRQVQLPPAPNERSDANKEQRVPNAVPSGRVRTASQIDLSCPTA